MKKKKSSPISIENCIHNLKEEGFWKPLPEREIEVDFINVFFDSSFASPDPTILIVSGPKSTGKTTVLRTCALMSEFEDMIFFFDCSLDDISEFQNPPDERRRLIVLDNFIRRKNFDLISIFLELNFSIVIVMQQYEKIAGLDKFDSINFSRYDKTKIQNILCEYMKEYSSIVPLEIIIGISNRVEESNESIEYAFQEVINFLQNSTQEEEDFQ